MVQKSLDLVKIESVDPQQVLQQLTMQNAQLQNQTIIQSLTIKKLEDVLHVIYDKAPDLFPAELLKEVTDSGNDKSDAAGAPAGLGQGQ